SDAARVRVSGGAASVFRPLLGDVLVLRLGLRHVLRDAAGGRARRQRGEPQHDAEVGVLQGRAIIRLDAPVLRRDDRRHHAQQLAALHGRGRG
ncbi:unnamed protein product, partial [Ectocarpus sp. 12 AP-2014]